MPKEGFVICVRSTSFSCEHVRPTSLVAEPRAACEGFDLAFASSRLAGSCGWLANLPRVNRSRYRGSIRDDVDALVGSDDQIVPGLRVVAQVRCREGREPSGVLDDPERHPPSDGPMECGPKASASLLKRAPEGHYHPERDLHRAIRTTHGDDQTMLVITKGQ
ncbi:MAG: hypothetical protein ABIP94_15175 [Planctomycetota bacterium]